MHDSTVRYTCAFFDGLEKNREYLDLDQILYLFKTYLDLEHSLDLKYLAKRIHIKPPQNVISLTFN